MEIPIEVTLVSKDHSFERAAREPKIADERRARLRLTSMLEAELSKPVVASPDEACCTAPDLAKLIPGGRHSAVAPRCHRSERGETFSLTSCVPGLLLLF